MLKFLLEHGRFWNVYISQGSVATYLRCDEIFQYDFVANLPLSLPVKEFCKSVNIWLSYGQQFCVFFFLTHSVYTATDNRLRIYYFHYLSGMLKD